MLPRMNIQQRRQANKLIKHLCTNYQDGNCLLLDDEPCVCVQSISYSLCCNYFRVAVLPTEPTLEAEILSPANICYCQDCKKPFVPKSKRNNQKFCTACAKRRHRMLMYGKEASNRKQEIDRQHYTIPNQRPKDKHCGKI